MSSDTPESKGVTRLCETGLAWASQSQYGNAETPMEQWLNSKEDRIIGLSAIPIEKLTNTNANTNGSVGTDSAETTIGSQIEDAECRMKQALDCMMNQLEGLSAMPKEEPTNANSATGTKTASEKTGPSRSTTMEKLNGVLGFRSTASSTAGSDRE